MLCQKCMQPINHKDAGDMIVDIRIKKNDQIYPEHLKLIFCLECANKLILEML